MYNNAVVAADLKGNDTPRLIEHARSMLDEPANVSVIHVVELDTAVEPADQALRSLESDYWTCEAHLAEICREEQLELVRQSIVIGPVSKSICRYARESRADLIVVGSQGRTQSEEILGATVSRVLQTAGCDVLVVATGQVAATGNV